MRTAGRIALVVALLMGLLLASVEPVTVAQYVPYAAVGGFLAIRRPRNAIGWLLCGIGFAAIGTTTPPGLDIDGLEAGTAAARDVIYAWVSVWAGGVSFLLYAALAMTFPSGRLPAGRWGRIGLLALTTGLAIVAAPAFLHTLRFSPDGVSDITAPNPVGILPDPDAGALPLLQVVVTAVPIALLAAGVVSLLVRYRRAGESERLQIRWLLAAIAFVVISVIGGLLVFVLSGGTAFWGWIPALIAYPTVPFAVGVAVTRYRLFDIDRIISRTISYFGVSAVLFAVFAGVTLGIRAIVGSAVGEGTLTVAVSTLVVAALFDPLRIRVQRVVDRRFNRSRYDGERTAEALAVGLRDEVDVERVLEAVRGAAERAVEPTAAAIWQRDRRAAS